MVCVVTEVIGSPTRLQNALPALHHRKMLIRPNRAEITLLSNHESSSFINLHFSEFWAKMEGYSKLASLMGDARTDGHFLIFQKFESISAQNLLYLQAEIINIKESIDMIAQIDSENPDRKDFAFDWETLSSSTDSVQYEKWLELRRKLKEYCKNVFKNYQLQSDGAQIKQLRSTG
jgi:hypothetical protein